MGFLVSDGKGRGFTAGVSESNRLLVAANSSSRSHFASVNGFCFNLVSIDPDAAANDYIAYLKNDSSTKAIVVDIARVQAVNAALWKFTVVTGTASGTTVTPVNLNLDSGTTADATALGNAAVTGLTAGSVFATARSPAATSYDVPFDDTVILREGDAIAVEYDTGTTGLAEVLIRFYQVDLTREL